MKAWNRHWVWLSGWTWADDVTGEPRDPRSGRGQYGSRTRKQSYRHGEPRLFGELIRAGIKEGV